MLRDQYGTFNLELHKIKAFQHAQIALSQFENMQCLNKGDYRHSKKYRPLNKYSQYWKQQK